jgi:tetratricopeptide (TPR) repeat protein
MKFGGYMMTYEVTDMSLIHIYDLGPNNTRVITPRYGDVKQLSTSQMKSTKSFLKSAKLSELRFIKKNEIEPINTSIKFPYLKEELPEEIKELIKTYDNEEINNSKKYVYIHMIKTYERIAEKGYKSIEIFQKIGDAFFFDGEYSKAAKWYGELFEMTTNLESEYYDRYIFSLKTIGEKNKAKEIVKKRNQLLGIQ